MHSWRGAWLILGLCFWLGLSGLPGAGQDTTIPALVSASSLNGQQIGICFNTEMDPASLTELVNYLVEDSTGLKGVIGAVPQPGNTGVLISLLDPVADQFSVTVGFLFDAAGNLVEPGSSVTGRVWQVALTLSDIGGPSPTGSVFTCSEGLATVQADGDFIDDRVDRFSFLYASRTNDFDVCVRVDELANLSNPYGAAGLMVRASLDPSSPHRMIFATATNAVNRVYLLARPLPGGLAEHIETGPKVDSYPIWLRLKRSGLFIIGFVSYDGSAWTQAGSTIQLPSLPPAVLVGLATGSGVSGSALAASYRHFGDTILVSNVSLAITHPPANTTVEANTAASFTVEATGAGLATNQLKYQWQAETSPGSGVFTNIDFANGPSYTTPLLAEADSGTGFRVMVFVSGNPPVQSPPAVVTVLPDATGPHLQVAVGTRSLHEVLLIFNEPLAPATATNLDNYNVQNLIVTNALLDPTQTRVLLELFSPQMPGTTSVVTVVNVKDTAGHLLDPNPTTASAAALAFAPGYALEELYYGIDGTSVAQLRASPAFPGFPNDLRYVPQLEGPNDFIWASGTRLSGFLIPPVTGNYNFWICSDDQGEFWLSTDIDPAHLALVCREPQFNLYRDYLGTTRRNAAAPENRSQTLFPAGIALQAGSAYSFEATSKNGFLYSHLSVAWQIPGGAPPTNGAAPIPGAYLSALADTDQINLSIQRQPADVPYSFANAAGAGPRVLLNESFNAGDGGFVPALTGDPTGGWAYQADLGAWTTAGSGSSSIPSDKTLTSPPLAVTRAGTLQLSFDHRYSFEYDGSIGWDGGQVLFSVNGGPFVPVPAAAFASNGYTRVIQGIAGLLGQIAFNGDSAGYDNAVELTSTARLGFFSTGDVVQVQFLGGWDEFTTGTSPNWLIDRVELDEGLPGGPAVTFSVAATGSVRFAPNQTVAYQWERDCGDGFQDVPNAIDPDLTFSPALSDAGCRFRCRVGLPGVTLSSEAAVLQVPTSPLRLELHGGPARVTWTGAGRLQQAPTPSGPWSDVSGTGEGSYILPLSGPQRFYRLSLP